MPCISNAAEAGKSAASPSLSPSVSGLSSGGTRIRTNNTIERLNREIKRWTKAIVRSSSFFLLAHPLFHFASPLLSLSMIPFPLLAHNGFLLPSSYFLANCHDPLKRWHWGDSFMLLTPGSKGPNGSAFCSSKGQHHVFGKAPFSDKSLMRASIFLAWLNDSGGMYRYAGRLFPEVRWNTYLLSVLVTDLISFGLSSVRFPLYVIKVNLSSVSSRTMSTICLRKKRNQPVPINSIAAAVSGNWMISMVLSSSGGVKNRKILIQSTRNPMKKHKNSLQIHVSSVLIWDPSSVILLLFFDCSLS